MHYLHAPSPMCRILPSTRAVAVLRDRGLNLAISFFSRSLADRSGESRLPRRAHPSPSLLTRYAHRCPLQIATSPSRRTSPLRDQGMVLAVSSFFTPTVTRHRPFAPQTAFSPKRSSSHSHHSWLPSPPSQCRRQPFPQLIQALHLAHRLPLLSLPSQRCFAHDAPTATIDHPLHVCTQPRRLAP